MHISLKTLISLENTVRVADNGRQKDRTVSNHCFSPVSPLSFLFLCVFKVVLVRWNEPFQKLATCDTDGGIFVWIQYEGRWSVELVNDRGAQVKKNPKHYTEMEHELN